MALGLLWLLPSLSGPGTCRHVAVHQFGSDRRSSGLVMDALNSTLMTLSGLSAPAHSITSSARASNIGGTSRPSALAVLRLTAK